MIHLLVFMIILQYLVNGLELSAQVAKKNGIRGNYTSPNFEPALINLLSDVGFYSFTFGGGNGGAFASQSFYFNLNSFSYLTITDCYCTGDRFFVYIDGIPTFSALAGCDSPDPLCTVYSEDPEECAFGADSRWCSGSNLMTYSGLVNVTIQVATSPFGSGMGFLLLQQACPQPSGWVPCCSLDNSCVLSIFQ